MNRFYRSTVLAFLLLLASCAWLKKAEPQIVHAVDTGCQVVEMVVTDPLVGAACIALDDLGKLFDILAAASFKGEAVSFRYVLPDGSFRDVTIAAHAVTDAATQVRGAMFRAGMK